MRPFRFGLSIGGISGRDDFVATVHKAEASGFEVISSADHIGRRLAVLPMLTAAAEISSLRISPMVMANDYRHPVVLAKDTATIDVLSGGRFELGIGTGWIEEQYNAAGIRYDPPRVRGGPFRRGDCCHQRMLERRAVQLRW
ncbi:MAG: LLM class flavin-dependent oxidoreductase [Acidimicrobiia bacterium]